MNWKFGLCSCKKKKEEEEEEKKIPLKKKKRKFPFMSAWVRLSVSCYTKYPDTIVNITTEQMWVEQTHSTSEILANSNANHSTNKPQTKNDDHP